MKGELQNKGYICTYIYSLFPHERLNIQSCFHCLLSFWNCAFPGNRNTENLELKLWSSGLFPFLCFFLIYSFSTLASSLSSQIFLNSDHLFPMFFTAYQLSSCDQSWVPHVSDWIEWNKAPRSLWVTVKEFLRISILQMTHFYCLQFEVLRRSRSGHRLLAVFVHRTSSEPAWSVMWTTLMRSWISFMRSWLSWLDLFCNAPFLNAFKIRCHNTNLQKPPNIQISATPWS